MEGRFGRDRALAAYDLGTIGYRDALDLQHRLVTERREGRVPDTLLLLEHPPVLTMGKSAVSEHVVASPIMLERAGVETVWIERGGETTYHGPGQIVGYVIVDLAAYLRSVKKFVYLIEELFVDTLATHYGIETMRDDHHTGVWVGNEKITAIGIAIQNRITFHGFAFNVNTDLSHYDWIVPCGITDRGQTSLERITGQRHDLSVVKNHLLETFTRLFGYPAKPPLLDRSQLPIPVESDAVPGEDHAAGTREEP